MAPDPARALLALLALALALVACGSDGALPAALPAPLPATSTEVEVRSLTSRAEYLDAMLVGEGFSGRLFFPDGPDCARVLRPGAQLRYRHSGPWGELSDDVGSCLPIGIATLERWRDARPKARPLAGARQRAQYHIVFTDDEYAFARGRFPLAALLGWSLADDAIAVIPRTPACKAPLDRGVASMEYRPRGPHALVLLSAEGTCPIVGLISPVREL